MCRNFFPAKPYCYDMTAFWACKWKPQRLTWRKPPSRSEAPPRPKREPGTFPQCVSLKVNEVNLNWRTRMFNALKDGRERSKSSFRRVNGLYSLRANQLGWGWAAKGHSQQEDILHSSFNFHMPPRLSAFATIQLEDLLDQEPNLALPKHSFVRSF